jgi:hypothetical protein
MTKYYINEAETIAYKVVSEGNYFSKEKGGAEEKADNNVEVYRKINDAIANGEIITEEEYNNF